MVGIGIDAGSRATKIVLVEGDSKRILAKEIAYHNVHRESETKAMLDGLLSQLNDQAKEPSACVATGYSRNNIQFADRTITEITCHGRGVHHLIPEARTIVEIGGQDSKVLHLSENGSVFDFSMNDRCAAGTGRFLEVVADRLGFNLDELGALASRSLNPSNISSMCIVFAETEIIGLLANGEPPENIVAGVQKAMTSRIAGMMGRNLRAPVVFTGGVAMVHGMREALESSLQVSVVSHPLAQFTGALGAALVAVQA